MTDKDNINSTKERILEAGKKLFSEKGFKATSVREIAQESGCNISMISYYFGGKDQLYSTIIDNFAEILKSFLSEDTSDLSPKEKIYLYARKMTEMHTKNPQVAKILRHEMNCPTQALAQLQRDLFPKIFKFLEEAFREGVERGDFRSDLNPVVMGYGVASLVNFYYFQNELVRRVNPGLKEMGTDIIDYSLSIFFNGINKSSTGGD